MPAPLHGNLPWLTPSELSGKQNELYRAIVGGKRAQHGQLFRLTTDNGQLEGPFNAMLINPTVGAPLQALGETIRYELQLSDREREIAILEVARLRRCDFEWYAHERVARDVGLNDDELTALMHGTFARTLTDRENAVRQLAQQLIEKRNVVDPDLQTLRQIIDDTEINAVIVLVGYYDVLALSINVWATPVPRGEPLSLLDNAPDSLQ